MSLGNHWIAGFVYIFRIAGTDRLIIGTSRNPKLQEKILSKELGELQSIANVWTFNMGYVANWMYLSYIEFNILEEYSEIDSREWFEANLITAVEMRVALFLMAGVINIFYVIGILLMSFTIFLVLTH